MCRPAHIHLSSPLKYSQRSPGSGIRGAHAGLGGEHSLRAAEVETYLDAARIVEVPEGREVGTREPDYGTAPGEPFDAPDQDLLLRAGEDLKPRVDEHAEDGFIGRKTLASQ